MIELKLNNLNLDFNKRYSSSDKKIKFAEKEKHELL